MEDADIVAGLAGGGCDFVGIGRYSLKPAEHPFERGRTFKVVIRDYEPRRIEQARERRFDTLGGFDLEIDACSPCRCRGLEMRNLLLDRTRKPPLVLLMPAGRNDV